MNRPSLVFKTDIATGLPRLEATGYELSDSEVRALEAELRKMFEVLIHNGHGRIVEFQTRARSLPQPPRFRVSIRRSDQRCPDLVFEPFDDLDLGLPSSDGASHERGRGISLDWSAGFLDEVEKTLFSAQALRHFDRADAAALRFIVEELRVVRAERPHEMAPLLVAAYASLGERMCRDTQDERIAMYALAARGLDRLFNSLLPAKPSLAAPDLREQPVQQVESSIKLRRVGRFLARLVGIDSDPVF
jgi:hypothetical protein